MRRRSGAGAPAAGDPGRAGANLLLGGLVTASLVAYDLPVAGSVSLGVAAALTGATFGAVALVAAQLSGSTRAAYGITGAVIAARVRRPRRGRCRRPGLLLAGCRRSAGARPCAPTRGAVVARPAAGRRLAPRPGGGRFLALFRRRDVGAGARAADRAGPSSGSARWSSLSGWPGACSAAA